METKICNNCKLQKQTIEFNKKIRKFHKIDYNHICKVCQSAKNKIKNKALKESQKIKIFEKHCINCKIPKLIKFFTKDIYQLDGFSKTCKICQSNYYVKNKDRISESNRRSQKKYVYKNNLRKMKWALENKNKIREANKKYYQNNIKKITEYNKIWAKKNVLAARSKGHRYRTRKKDNTIQNFTKIELEQRMSVFGFKCAYCLGPFEHIDHVKPISKGGYHCLSNLRPSCKKCNQQKFNKTLFEWLNERNS